MGPVLRAACLQMRLAESPELAVEHAAAMAREAAARGAELALLPEYWFLPAGEGPVYGADPRFLGMRDALQGISRGAGLALAGNALERRGGSLWNALCVFDRGRLVGEQRKLHPMPTEERWGVAAARELEPLPWGPTRLGGLVCADVLHPEAARILALRGAEVLLNPVMSYLKPHDPTKEARRAMFIARAYDNACFVLKAGSVGPSAGRPLVGRSLVAAPWGIVAEAKDELAEDLVVADLDLVRLREERRRSLSLPRRHPEAYGPLADPALQARPGEAKPEEGFDI